MFNEFEIMKRGRSDDASDCGYWAVVQRGNDEEAVKIGWGENIWLEKAAFAAVSLTRGEEEGVVVVTVRVEPTQGCVRAFWRDDEISLPLCEWRETCGGVLKIVTPEEREEISLKISVTMGLPSSYEWLEVLGIGSQAQVKRVRRNGLDFAAKIFNKSLPLKHGTTVAEALTSALDDARGEAELMLELRHENIVQVHDWFETERHLVVVMDLCRGGDLYSLIEREGPLPISKARRMALEMAKSLRFLHSRHVTHRDVKPTNFLLADNGRILLSDFGTAYFFGSHHFLTRRVWTPLYQAPEMLSGAPYTCEVDVWSLGVSIYAIATGFMPFGSEEEILRGEFDESQIQDPLLSDLLKKMMCLDPRKRITMDQVCDHPFFLIVEEKFRH